jgi:hypothetical protein
MSHAAQPCRRSWNRKGASPASSVAGIHTRRRQLVALSGPPWESGNTQPPRAWCSRWSAMMPARFPDEMARRLAAVFGVSRYGAPSEGWARVDATRRGRFSRFTSRAQVAVRRGMSRKHVYGEIVRDSLVAMSSLVASKGGRCSWQLHEYAPLRKSSRRAAILISA